MKSHNRDSAARFGSGMKLWFLLAAAVAVIALVVGLSVGLRPGSHSLSTAGGGEAIEQPDLGVSGARYEVEKVDVSSAALDFRPPSTLAVYEIAPVEGVTRESMDRVAALLGMGTSRQYESDGLSDGRIGIRFPSSEDASCLHMLDQLALGELEKEFGKGAEIKLPSNDEARKISDQTLDSLGLLKGLSCYAVKVCDRFTESTKGQPDRSSDVTLGVWYRATVGGLALVGPGARVCVVLGPGGKIVEVRHYAQRAVESAKQVQVRSVSAALEDVKQGRGQVPSDLSELNCKEIVVESIQMVYHAAPMPMDVHEYRPAYLLQVRLSDGSLGEWVVSAYEDGDLPVLATDARE